MTATPPSSVLAGHRAARDALVGALDDLTPGDGRGRGRVALVRGEAGIGKTWTVDALAAEAARRGHLVLRGAATDGGVLGPFGLWLPIGRQLLTDARLRGPRQRQANASAHLAAMVPVLDEIDGERVGPSRSVSRDEQPLVFAEAIVALLSAVSLEQRVVLILDDLHWGDPDSLQVLGHVSSRLGDVAVLLVGAHRPDPPSGYSELTDLVGAIRRQPRARFIDLRRLDADDLASMLDREAGGELAPALVRVISEESSGNPLYARELVRALVERGSLGDAGRTVADDDEARALVREAGIPPGIREIVRQRLGRLDPLTGELLRSMALLAVPADITTLEQLASRVASGPNPEPWVRCMDQALDAGLVRSTPDGFVFEHDIIKHAIGEEPNAARSALRHRDLAEILVARVDAGGSAIDGFAFEVARQYAASAPLEGADAGLPWCFRAAAEASTAGAVRQCVAALRFGTELLAGASPPVRAELLAELAMAEAHALLWRDAAMHGPAALAAMVEADASPEARIDLIGRFAEAMKDAGAPPEAWSPLVHEGLSLLAATDTRDVWWARLTLLIEPVEPMRSGSIHVGRWTGHDPAAVALVEQAGDDGDLRLAVLPNDWRDEAELGELVDRARSAADVAVRLHVLDTVGRSRLFRFGDHAGADDVLAECADEAEQVGAVAVQASALAMRTMCVSNLGDLAGADALWRQAAGLADELGPAHRVRFVTGTLSAAWLGLLSGAGAFRTWADVATAMVTSEAGGANAAGMSLAGFAVLCRGLDGDRDGVRALVRDVVSLLTMLPRDDYTVNGSCTTIAHGCFAVDEPEGANELLVVIDDLLAAGRRMGPGGPLLLAKGQALSLLGDHGRALACLAEAQEECEPAGLAPAAALAELAAVRTRLGRGEASGSLATARDDLRQRFDALGMHGWVRRLDDLVPEGSGSSSSSSASRSGGAPPKRDRPGGLSKRELEVLGLVAVGRSNKEIAADLVISLATAQRHVANIYIKLGVRNRAEATAWAYRNGIV